MQTPVEDHGRSDGEAGAASTTAATRPPDLDPTTALVSVVVPVYNDAEGLERTLSSLAVQSHDDYEVIVVDNDSTDRTLARAREWERDIDHFMIVRETDVQGSYAARNTGLEHAAGDVIAFVDADVWVPNDWLSAGLETMTASGAGYVGCRVDLSLEARTLPGLYDAHVGFPVERYVTENRFAPTCALFVARAVFEDVGAFDATLVSGGDVEFGQRVAAAGWALAYTDDVAVDHPARTGLRSLLGKHRRVGRGVEQRARRYPDRYEPRALWHPIGLCPPHPGRFPALFGDAWGGLRYRERLGVYAVGHLVRLSRIAGRALERFSRGDRVPTDRGDRVGTTTTGR